MGCRVGNFGCPGHGQRTHRLTDAGQAGNFAVLLAVLHEVALSDGERASPTWLAGFETHTMENVVTVIICVRQTREGGLASPPRRGLLLARLLRAFLAVGLPSSYTMIEAAVLAKTGSVADLVRTIGQAFGAIGVVAVAVVAHRWNRRERRGRETEQATRVAIEVDYATTLYGNGTMSVKITNHSEQSVLRTQIESMGEAWPPVKWGWDQVHLVDDD